jgi:hypothetical protein
LAVESGKGEVLLPALGRREPSASAFLDAVLRSIVQQFPDVFGALPAFGALRDTPSRRALAARIERIEPLRGASPRRTDIARFTTELIQRTMEIGTADRRLPLDAAFRETVRPLAIVPAQRELGGGDGRNRGRLSPLTSEQIRELRQSMLATDEAIDALESLRSAIDRHSIDLSGHTFVLLGGTAELSPLGLLLSLDATVLTTHTSTQSLRRRLASEFGEDGGSGGRLHVISGGVDLLRSPVELSRSILEFADDKPIHIGALAYSGGQAKEWRLGAAMNGIIRAVRDAGLLGSVFYYLTPSMVTEVSPATAGIATEHLARSQRPWTNVVRPLTLNVLFRQNIAEVHGRYWSRSVVPAQGASYMGANLFEKIHAAEVFANPMTSPTRVSANVAPITRTESTATPQTRQLFPELARMGVTVFEPAVARTVMASLLVHDLFRPLPGGTDLFRQQVHGGVFTNAWALESLMTMAYARARLRRFR